MISRIQLSAILLVATGVWGVSLIVAGVQVKPEWLRPFSLVLWALVVVVALADKVLWRFRWLQPWLFDMPDLRGTWRVLIHRTGLPEAPTDIEAYMVIRQTLSSISLRLFTADSHSETLSAKVVRCDDGTWTLAGVYRNTPRLAVRKDSPLHHGAILLSVQGKNPASLSGEYWTDRQSQGEIALSDRCTKLAHSFDEAHQHAASGTRPTA